MSGLSPEELTLFHREGYLHVPDALQDEDLDPVQRELEGIVDAAARRLLAAGKIDRDFAELPFEKRLIPLAKVDASAVHGINFPNNLGKGILAFCIMIACWIWCSPLSGRRSTPIRASTSAPSCRPPAITKAGSTTTSGRARPHGIRIWACCCPRPTIP